MRAIEVDYEYETGIVRPAAHWWEVQTLRHEMRATHGQALYRLLRTLPRFGIVRPARKFCGLRVYVYRGKGSKEDHARFRRLERELKRLVKLSTEELRRRLRPKLDDLP